MSGAPRAIALALVLLVAGCNLPVGVSQTPTGTATGTATPEPTPTEYSPFPAGITEADGIENASALLEAHTRALNRTGYVSIGRGNTTVHRAGFLVNVTSEGAAEVAAGSRHYYEWREVDAGLVTRRVEMFGNGTHELHRTVEGGDESIEERPPRPRATLASRGLLEPILRGGDFEVTRVQELESPPLITLRANRTENETALLEGLPENAESVESFEGTAVVDDAGRVWSLEATTVFRIGGENRTHHVEYQLQSTGVEEVERPDWVDQVSETPTATPTGEPTPTATPTTTPGDEAAGTSTPTPEDDRSGTTRRAGWTASAAEAPARTIEPSRGPA